MNILKIIGMIFVLSAPVAASETKGVDCKKHKIYCKIISLRPNISKKKAMKVSNAIYTYAKKWGGDPMLAVAIAMKETSINEKRQRRGKVIVFHTLCNEDGMCEETWTIEKGVTDVCMFQFHVNTILNYNIDPVKLKNDLNYCTEWHFRLMSIKKKSCKNLERPWSCYHSNTKVFRESYADGVEEFL